MKKIDGYNIVSAKYANISGTSVLLKTEDRGLVAKDSAWAGWDELHSYFDVQPAEDYVLNHARRAEILSKLHEIDLASIRPLRAGETEKLAELETQAQALRAEMAGL